MNRRTPEQKAAAMEYALEEALEFIESYVDVVDGDYGQPAPNKAMQVSQTILHALGRRPG
jgi:hypothetical protein